MPDLTHLSALFSEIVGSAHVSTDPDQLRRASHDLFPFPQPELAAVVVCPGTTAEVSQVVVAAAGAGVAVVARGAGLSYTGGLSSRQRALVLDTRRLNRIEVRPDDAYVVAGAGLNWDALSQALSPYRLRSQLPGPVSGSVSTIGGAISQALPGSMEGVIGLEVVLADGTIARTGSWALNQTPAFMRQCGPDLTGMFIGDGGSLAVKTAVVLRLVPERDLSFASFSYASPEQLMADLVRIQRLGCVTRLLALDRHKGEQARKVDTAEAIKVAGAVASKSGSALQAVRHVASLVRGRRDLGRAQWTLHLTAEGETPDIARARINLARTICGENAEEIEDLVPRASAARPFSIRGFLGPQGERWVPIHGIVPLSRAFATLAALKSYFDRIADELSELGIERSMLMSSSGAFVTIEPMFLWPDELDPIHFEHLADRHRERFGGRPANPQARAAVMRYRSDLRAIFEQQGAVHVQLARFYRYADRLDAGSLALLKRLQKAVDPDFRLNPGALGLTL